METLASMLRSARARFSEAGLDDPAGDARVLITGLLGLSATTLVTDPARPLGAADIERVEDAVERRLKREPVHRILGHREFYGLKLRLSPETLEPRPDTEILVDRVLPYLQRIVALRGRASIVDFGTGTGAIALALLSQCPEADALGVDISTDALETAAMNADTLGLAPRFRTLKSHWAEDVSGRFDIVVSNPPYIVHAVMKDLSPEVQLHDPEAALDGGADGLDAYRALAAAIPGCLAEDGVVGLEIGHDQRESVSQLFAQSGFALIEAVKDYGDNDRVLLFSRAG